VIRNDAPDYKCSLFPVVNAAYVIDRVSCNAYMRVAGSFLCRRLLSEVDPEKEANASTGCDDNDFVDIIFADLAAVKALPPEVYRAYKYVVDCVHKYRPILENR